MSTATRRAEEQDQRLEQYRREWDDELKAFGKEPVKDWTTDYADAFRYMSLAWKTLPVLQVPEPKRTGWVIPPPGEPVQRRLDHCLGHRVGYRVGYRVWHRLGRWPGCGRGFGLG